MTGVIISALYVPEGTYSSKELLTNSVLNYFVSNLSRTLAAGLARAALDVSRRPIGLQKHGWRRKFGQMFSFFVSSDFEQNCFNWCCLICVLCFQMNNINTLFYGKINWILQFERNLRRKTSIYIVKRKPQKLLNSSIKYIFDQTLTNDFLVF